MVRRNGLVITSRGMAIGGTSDQFQFSYQVVSGNFDLSVRLAGLSLSDTWAKAGMMARETLTPGRAFRRGAGHAAINGCFFEWRDPAKATNQSGGSFPDNYPNTWLRLNRVGNFFSGFASYDGQTWTLLASQTIALSNQLYLGFAVDSDQTNQTVTAQFLQITNTPANAVVGTVPYPYEPPGRVQPHHAHCHFRNHVEAGSARGHQQLRIPGNLQFQSLVPGHQFLPDCLCRHELHLSAGDDYCRAAAIWSSPRRPAAFKMSMASPTSWGLTTAA